MTMGGNDPPRPDDTGTVEFVASMRKLRRWSGLTFRELAIKAQASGGSLPASTLASALNRTSLPRQEIVAEFARACGLDEVSVANWVAARDRVAARTGETSQDSDAGATSAARPVTGGSPAMLPPDIPDFTGRTAEVAALLRVLGDASPAKGRPTALTVVAIVGMGGVGKTALAVHAAHLLADAYPDGQLWVNLRGAEASPLEPGDVLARFLRALGMPDRAIPGDPVERAEAYRTLVAGRRILVVLDNAASEQQVRPLLPGTASCAVLVTSRDRLTGIEGVRRINLDVFPSGEAIQLLARITGDDRVAIQRRAAAEIVELCGGLPLAVRIAGARLAARPGWQLEHLAAMLSDERRRLDRLATGDLAVRTSLALSYQALDEQPRRLLRLLGLFNVPDFPAWLGAAILECPLEDAIEYAEALVDAHLLAVGDPDPVARYRYRLHDLVRLFAFERAHAEESAESRLGALRRGLGGWLALAERMARRIPGPCYALIHGPAPRPPIDWAAELVSGVAPEDWFDAERVALLAAVRQACALGLDDLAFDLAGCLEKYFDLRGMFADWISLNTEVLEVCQRTGNLLGEAVMLRGLIDVRTWTTETGQGEAMAGMRADAFRLLDMFTRLGHEQGMSDAAVMCSWALTASGDYQEAIPMADRALRLAERSNHLGGQARAQLALAVAHFEHARLDLATWYTAQTLRTARVLGNPRWEATALQFSGIAHLEMGDLDTSLRMLTESLAIATRYQDTYTEVLTLLALARLYLRRGDPQARGTAVRSLALSREYRMNHHLAEALGLLGEIELADGNAARAIQHLEESVALWRTRGWRSFQAATLASLGRAYALAGRREQARQAFDEAQAHFESVGKTARAAEVERLSRALDDSSTSGAVTGNLSGFGACPPLGGA